MRIIINNNTTVVTLPVIKNNTRCFRMVHSQFSFLPVSYSHTMLTKRSLHQDILPLGIHIAYITHSGAGPGNALQAKVFE